MRGVAVLCCVSDSHQDSLSSFQEFAVGSVEEDAILFQGGTSCGGQTTGPGAATITAKAVAIPVRGARGGTERERERAMKGHMISIELMCLLTPTF